MFPEKTSWTLPQSGDSLIEEAISGNLIAVRQLVQCGADVNFANANTVTPLMAAAQWKRLDVIEFLLENGASLRSVDEADGRTALMYACLSGSHRCAELLVEAGADVNVRDRYGMTALMMAAAAGGTEMVRLLVDAGAEVEAHDELGFTAMDWAKKWEKKNVIGLLLSEDGRDKKSR